MLLQQIIRGILREAVADDGGAEGATAAPARQSSQQPGGEKRSVHERLKSFLFAPEADSDAHDGEDAGDEQGDLPAPAAKQTKKPAPKTEKAPEGQAESEDANEAPSDHGADEAVDFTTLSELADRTGLTLDRILDLSVAGKVGDKETKASIREMLRSYQTSELLNGKLQTHASEVAAWKTEQQQQQAAHQQNLQRMDAGLQVAQRLLQGEFASVNWEHLQQADPNQFAQAMLGFQQRQAMLSQLADQLGKERQSQQAQQAEQHKAWLAEQKQLLEAKLPGWSDKPTREAALKEIADVVGKAYGFDASHLSNLTDHRDFLVLSDALKWQKLQASKAQVMNKVRTAPKLLKPGAAQSSAERAGTALSEAKARAKKTGSVRDVAKALRSIPGLI